MTEEIYHKNIDELKEKFIRIRELGWVKGVSKGTGNAGDTFEFYLGKERENFPIADFQGIEIKTRVTNNSKIPINLFSAIPYGEEFFENKRILERYGVENEKRPGTKKFCGTVFGNFRKKIYSDDITFRLLLCRKERKLRFASYDSENELIENSTYWPFDIIEKKVTDKLNYVAIVKAKKKIEYGETFFLYENMTIYKLRGIEDFWKAVSHGVVFVCFAMGSYRDEKYSHLIHDHGTAFRIRKYNWDKLFVELDKL